MDHEPLDQSQFGYSTVRHTVPRKIWAGSGLDATTHRPVVLLYVQLNEAEPTVFQLTLDVGLSLADDLQRAADQGN